MFPCDENKRPRTDHGFKDASRDSDVIRSWWARWPAATVGVSCGPARLLVVDCDTAKNGEQLPARWQEPGVVDGADVFATLLKEHGCGFPLHVVYTPSGGMHCYYRAPDDLELGSPVRLFPLVDIRARGGYVIAAGPGYVRCGLPLSDVPPAPPWLVEAIHARAARPPVPAQPAIGATGDPDQRLHGLLRTMADAANGERNNVLHWCACRVAELAEEVSLVDAVTALASAAIGAGLTPSETASTIRSALTRQGVPL